MTSNLAFQVRFLVELPFMEIWLRGLRQLFAKESKFNRFRRFESYYLRHFILCPYRLTVRTLGFHPSNLGSIPGRGTTLL